VISSTNPFFLQTFEINPGLQSWCPWLANLAAMFEQHCWVSGTLRFESEASTAAPGYVMLGIDYDAADPAPTSKSSFASYLGTDIANVWLDQTIHFDKRELGKQKLLYNRYGPLAANLDIHTYDVGKFYVATGANNTNARAIGDIWFEYVVEFATPHTRDNDALVSTSSFFDYGVPTAPFIVSTPAVKNTKGLLNCSCGTFPYPDPENFAGASFLLRRAGQYLVEMFVNDAAGTIEPGTPPSLLGGAVSAPASLIEWTVNAAQNFAYAAFGFTAEALQGLVKDQGMVGTASFMGSVSSLTSVLLLISAVSRDVSSTIPALLETLDPERSKALQHNFKVQQHRHRKWLADEEARKAEEDAKEEVFDDTLILLAQQPARRSPRSPRAGAVFFPGQKSESSTPAGVGGTFVSVPRDVAPRSSSTKR